MTLHVAVVIVHDWKPSYVDGEKEGERQGGGTGSKSLVGIDSARREVQKENGGFVNIGVCLACVVIHRAESVPSYQVAELEETSAMSQQDSTPSFHPFQQQPR